MTLPIWKNMELQELDNAELYNLFCEVRAEMGARKLPTDVGNVGEQRVLKYFYENSLLPNLAEAARGTKNVDALSRDGERYSIKTVVTSRKTSSIYPDSEPEKSLFEYIVIARLDESFAIKELYRLSWGDFLSVRAWDKRMSAWYVPVNDKRLRGVERIL